MNLTTADQIFMKLYLIDTILTNNVKDIKNINFKNSRKEKKKKNVKQSQLVVMDYFLSNYLSLNNKYLGEF